MAKERRKERVLERYRQIESDGRIQIERVKGRQ